MGSARAQRTEHLSTWSRAVAAVALLGPAVYIWGPRGARVVVMAGAGLTVLAGIALVSRWRRQVERLQEAEERYRTLVEQIPAVVHVDAVDHACSSLYIGPQIEALLGWSPAEWQSRPDMWMSRIHPEDRHRVLLARTRAHEAADRFACEYRLVGRSDEVVWVRDETILVKRPDGRPRFWQGVFTDITSERAAAEEHAVLEARLRHAQKMEAVGQLAGGVAHEFNNLLAVILNFTRFVHDDLDDDAKKEDLSEVLKAGDRAATLVRQLLTFSRKEIVAPELLDLNEVISDVSALLRRAVPADVSLRTDLAPDIERVVADRGQVDQILMNLTLNAVDAMPDGGSLEIRTSSTIVREGIERDGEILEAGPYVSLSVTDTGAGMADEVRSRIFEPFFTTKERGSGTGLGLSTVYGIVKRAGGSIDVISAPNAGTSFRVLLPAVLERDELARQASGLSEEPVLSTERIEVGR